jgi:DNA repair protein RecN (Recombination protein N)
MAESLSDILSSLNDIAAELRDYYDNMEHDPSEIERIEARLDLIYGLKRKYGSTTDEILAYYRTIKERFDFINNSEEEISRLNLKKAEFEKEMLSICKELSALRKAAANNIQEQIIDTLRELGMKDVQFHIQFDRKDTFSLNGFDRVEFFISPNAGESLKPLAKTASGGEMSRVMLALKTVLADVDNIETFIFDEIDTGVSGRTAQKVAEKLSVLSAKHQLLCITHLPQIAAMADDHYLIEKKTGNGRTTTSIQHLDSERIIEEIARLTGGAQITEVTLKAAAEMKQMAMKIKKQ